MQTMALRLSLHKEFQENKDEIMNEVSAKLSNSVS
jgi:hypothetical protein